MGQSGRASVRNHTQSASPLLEMWERLEAPTDNPGIEELSELDGSELDNGGSVNFIERAYAVWTKQKRRKTISKLGNNINWNSVGVATIQMGDRSAREPMKVVPSRDITPGRRKEPLNRGLPNGTSFP